MRTTTRYPRQPSILVIAACAFIALIYFKADAAIERQRSGPDLAEIERAIADPGASDDLWLLYGDRLVDGSRYRHAAMAFQRVLDSDPYCRVANLKCAMSLALDGNADTFFVFLEHLVTLDPRLTQDILRRAESQRFLTAERFKNLASIARVQSMD